MISENVKKTYYCKCIIAADLPKTCPRFYKFDKENSKKKSKNDNLAKPFLKVIKLLEGKKTLSVQFSAVILICLTADLLLAFQRILEFSSQINLFLDF